MSQLRIKPKPYNERYYYDIHSTFVTRHKPEPYNAKSTFVPLSCHYNSEDLASYT